MALNIGSVEINDVYRGATPLSAIYRGANLVWPTTVPVIVNYNITDFDNGLLGMSTSQYNTLEFYNDITYIKIND
jgi:hypothetical protein